MARGHSCAQQARAWPHRVPAAPYAEWASGAPIKRAGRGGERTAMAADYRIIDADGHVMELDEQLAEYIGPPYDGLEWHRSYTFWPGLTADGYLRSLRQRGGWAGGGSGPNAEDWLRFLDINHIE